jgi:hypothetical protein
MKRKYYEPDGTINEESFAKRLEELHDEVDGADLNGLLSIRNRLYALKRKYEESGRRFLDCEYEILALNEIIAEEKK